MRHQTTYKSVDGRETNLEFEHLPLNTSNPVTGSKWLTRIYLFVPPSTRYNLGQEYGKLDDSEVKILFEETLKAKEHERDYGQRTYTDRKMLSPIRDRGKTLASQNTNPRVKRLF